MSRENATQKMCSYLIIEFKYLISKTNIKFEIVHGNLTTILGLDVASVKAGLEVIKSNSLNQLIFNKKQ